MKDHIKNVANLYSSKLDFIASHQDDPIVDGISDADLAIVDAQILTGAGRDEVVRSAEQKQAEAMNVYPAGLVGDIARYSMDSSPVPNRPFALMAGLLAVSLLSRNRYIVPPFNTRLNLYVAAVGETGSGKDAPPQSVNTIAWQVGAGECATEGVASGVALQRALSEAPHHSMFFWQDEIWEMITASQGHAASTHKRELTSVIMTLYGRAGGTYAGRKYANVKDNIEPIDKPYMVFGGATTPVRFMEALSSKHVADGFLNRMIVFQSSGIPELQPPKYRVMPPELTERLAKYYDTRYAAGTALPKHLALIAVKRESGVDKRLSQFARECREITQSSPDMGALWSRGYENAVKVAGLLAVGVEHESPVITMEQANWAIRLVKHCLKSFGLKLEQHMSEGEFDSQCKTALEYIRNPLKYTGDSRWGGFCARGLMPRGLLSKRLRNVKSSGVDQIIDKLLDSGEIRAEHFEANTCYVMADSVPHVG